jgi:hypothetical protein
MKIFTHFECFNWKIVNEKELLYVHKTISKKKKKSLVEAVQGMEQLLSLQVLHENCDGKLWAMKHRVISL